MPLADGGVDAVGGALIDHGGASFALGPGGGGTSRAIDGSECAAGPWGDATSDAGRAHCGAVGAGAGTGAAFAGPGAGAGAVFVGGAFAGAGTAGGAFAGAADATGAPQWAQNRAPRVSSEPQ